MSKIRRAVYVLASKFGLLVEGSDGVCAGLLFTVAAGLSDVYGFNSTGRGLGCGFNCEVVSPGACSRQWVDAWLQ